MVRKKYQRQDISFNSAHRKAKIEFARVLAEKVVTRYPRLGDRLDIAMLIRDILELNSFATKP